MVDVPELQRQVPAVPRRWCRGRLCDHAVKAFRVAQHLVETVDTYSASVRGWLYGRISHNFFLKVELGILRSILASLPANMAPEEGAALVVNGSGMHSTGFAGMDAPRAVFPMFVGSSDSRSASVAEQFFPRKSGNCSMSVLSLQTFSAVWTLRGWIF